jgi:hypothetical protein
MTSFCPVGGPLLGRRSSQRALGCRAWPPIDAICFASTYPGRTESGMAWIQRRLRRRPPGLKPSRIPPG